MFVLSLIGLGGLEWDVAAHKIYNASAFVDISEPLMPHDGTRDPVRSLFVYRGGCALRAIVVCCRIPAVLKPLQANCGCAQHPEEVDTPQCCLHSGSVSLLKGVYLFPRRE